MKFAFILDELQALKPAKDSSIEMMRRAYERGHEVFAIEPGGLSLWDGQVQGECRQLRILPGDLWFESGPPLTVPLQNFDAVLMRKDPPFDAEYLFATYLLELAEGQGARVYNRARAIRDFNEKLATARFPHLAPRTVTTRSEHLLRRFLMEEKEVILKPLDAMGGAGVFRVKESDPNLSVILETLTHYGSRTIMAQRYLPEILHGDKRILVVDGEVMPYCLARIPAPGETRGNLAAGGTGVAKPIDERDREIAEAVAPTLRDQGLLLVGLDVIGDRLTEINVTSPTCMREIRDQTGFDVAERVVSAIERRVRAS